MANIFEVNRPGNQITLGTTNTIINIASLTASKILALNASKNLEVVTVGSGLDYTRPTLSLDINSLAAATIVAGDFVPFWDITATATNKKTTFANFEAALTHDNLVAGTIASHDTSATGAELDSLTDDSIVNNLHRHSQLVASDGDPDPALYLDADGDVLIDNKLGLGVSPTVKLDVRGKILVSSQASPWDVTNTRQYGVELHYSGNDYNVTAIRARAQLVTTDTSASAQGALLQAANNDNINAGVLNGALIEAIGKATTNAATITMMRGCLVNTEWSAKDTVTDLRVLHVRTHTRDAATEGYVSGTGYGIYIENEAVGGNGQALDGGIYFKGTNLSAGNSAFTYGIDFSGATYGTTEIKLKDGGTVGSSGASVNISSAGVVTIGNDLIFSADKVIRRDTSDGSDDGVLALYGGGGEGNTRGAFVRLFGNEYAGSDGGDVVIDAGNVSTGDIHFATNGQSRVTINYGGQVKLLTGCTLYITEKASALADISGSGQIWVKTGAPCELWYADETGVEHLLSDVKSKRTYIGGWAIKLTNETGANTIAGQVVMADSATNDAVVLCDGATTADSGDIPIGVFLDSGVADGSEAWVVVSGIADVAMEDNVAAVRNYWVGASADEDGYADVVDHPKNAPDHMHEIGHCIESVAAGGGGTHILARCVLHFN